MTTDDPTSSELQPMRVRVQPGMSDWQLGDADNLTDQRRNDRAGLLARCDDRARALDWPGTGLSDGRGRAVVRVIATGHQAQLWHPGILAKDLAAIAAAKEHDAVALHLVVDQDEHPVWQVDLPRVHAGRVEVKRHILPGPIQGVPTGFQPVTDPQQLADWLGGLGVPIPPRLDGFETLAQQVAGVLDHWREEVFGPAGRVPIVFGSDLVQAEDFSRVVGQLREHARPAITAYNRAVYAAPEAKLRPLAITREWVELPLWACRWNRPRQRVFADLGDRRAILVDETGERIGHDSTGGVTLMPRALLMTALLRQTFCDLFIHGTGGGIYDRATEQWWRHWQGEPLAPRATVTADVFLDLDVPLATGKEVERAVWYRHHLPFNVDRFAEVDGALNREKQTLLEHMDDDRDKARRSKAFYRIHDINEQFVERHPELLKQADDRLRQARIGLSNRKAMSRRDWCFAIYPREQLRELRQAIIAK